MCSSTLKVYLEMLVKRGVVMFVWASLKKDNAQFRAVFLETRSYNTANSTATATATDSDIVLQCHDFPLARSVWRLAQYGKQLRLQSLAGRAEEHQVLC